MCCIYIVHFFCSASLGRSYKKYVFLHWFQLNDLKIVISRRHLIRGSLVKHTFKMTRQIWVLQKRVTDSQRHHLCRMVMSARIMLVGVIKVFQKCRGIAFPQLHLHLRLLRWWVGYLSWKLKCVLQCFREASASHVHAIEFLILLYCNSFPISIVCFATFILSVIMLVLRMAMVKYIHKEQYSYWLIHILHDVSQRRVLLEVNYLNTARLRFFVLGICLLWKLKIINQCVKIAIQ